MECIKSEYPPIITYFCVVGDKLSIIQYGISFSDIPWINFPFASDEYVENKNFELYKAVLGIY